MSILSFYNSKYGKTEAEKTEASNKIDESGLYQYQIAWLAVEYIDILKALDKANKAAIEKGNESLIERMAKVEAKTVVHTIGEIVASGVESRLEYLENSVKRTAANKAEVLSNRSVNTAGSAAIRLKEQVSKIMQYNESQENTEDRIYLSTSCIKKDITGKDENGKEVVLIKGIRTNSDVLNKYFEENEDEIIKHNVDMGTFSKGKRYVNKAVRPTLEAKARKLGWNG